MAVVANNTWAAMQGRKALDVEWTPGEWGNDSSTRRWNSAAARRRWKRGNIVTGRSKGDMAADLVGRGASRRSGLPGAVPRARHHGAAGGDDSIAGGRVKLIASLQSPGGASRMINAITGISRLNIDIELPRSGGGFGRRLENDFVAEAAMVAQSSTSP